MLQLYFGPEYNPETNKEYMQWCPISYKDQCVGFWENVNECTRVETCEFSSKDACIWKCMPVPCGDFSPKWLEKLKVLHQQALNYISNEAKDRAWETNKAANAAKADEDLSPEEREAANRRNQRASAAEGCFKDATADFESIPSELIDVLDFIFDISIESKASSSTDAEMADAESADSSNNTASKPAGRVSSKQFSMREMFEEGKANLRKQNTNRQVKERWFQWMRRRQGTSQPEVN
jgi:hypothetical protein